MANENQALIVDGNRPMTTMLQRFLQHHGLSAQVAVSITEAQEMLARQGYALVITDLFSPGATGLGLVAEVRRRYPGTRVIVMAPFGALDGCQQALAAGADACINKPFSLHHLWRVIEQTGDPQGPPGVAAS